MKTSMFPFGLLGDAQIETTDFEPVVTAALPSVIRDKEPTVSRIKDINRWAQSRWIRRPIAGNPIATYAMQSTSS
jgi:hypothetical protein